MIEQKDEYKNNDKMKNKTHTKKEKMSYDVAIHFLIPYGTQKSVMCHFFFPFFTVELYK